MKVAGITWQDKIERVQYLSSQQDAANDVLLFYANATEPQRGTYR